MCGNRTCVFSDINDRLPATAVMMLDSMLPNSKMSREDTARAYADMLAWLQDNRSWVFPAGATSHCLVHEKQCAAFPCVDESEGPALQPEGEVPEPSQKRLRRRLFQSDSESAPVPRKKLLVNMAGTTCCGWSSVGKGLHFADPSERPHAIWVTERRRRAEMDLEDVVFSECTTRYPVQEKLGVLQETHEILSIVINPMALGWPVRRNRLFACALNRQSVAWMGPGQEDLLPHFLKFCGADLMLTGDVFLVAPMSEVCEAENAMASRRGFRVAGTDRVLSMSQIYAPGMLNRYHGYEEARAALLESGEVSGESWFADLDQTLGAGTSTPGQVLPSALTHFTIHSWAAKRMVLNKEVYLAHGYNTYPEATRWPIPFQAQDHVLSLSSSSQKQLVGNGWHLPTMASWIFYVLAHTVKINREASIEPEKTLLRRGGSSLGGLTRGRSSLSLGSPSDVCDSQETLSLGADC
ncbi:unnamed protein product [Symbiodinium natans]|uniref:Uncharacterized protein n=1 Tax=Symbiodinium natans TaxID=878477 RepID=A0A812LTV3_9DINO|nr:unnamed protein product [Symbiodinium natans]